MRAGLLALTLCVLCLAASASAQTGTVTIPSVGPGGVASLPAAAELARGCTIRDVAAFTNRVHIHCLSDGGRPSGSLYSRDYQPPPQPDANVSYFAVGAAADPALADRVIALAASASQQNKQVTVFYRTDPAENPPGCLPSDCRRLTGLVMLVR
jgi:hypothetical protein